MTFTLRYASTASPERLWSVVTDLARHGDYVPATTMRVDDGPQRVGWGFVARTALGPLHLDDAMVVTAWDPPTTMRIVKVGRMLGGWAEAVVAPTGSGAGSTLTWRESVVPCGLPRVLHRLADAVAAPAYDRVLRSLVAAAEGSA